MNGETPPVPAAEKKEPAHRASVLAAVLNRALGLGLSGFTEAKVFLRSPEGSAMLDAWLARRGAAGEDDDEEDPEP